MRIGQVGRHVVGDLGVQLAERVPRRRQGGVQGGSLLQALLGFLEGVGCFGGVAGQPQGPALVLYESPDLVTQCVARIEAQGEVGVPDALVQVFPALRGVLVGRNLPEAQGDQGTIRDRLGPLAVERPGRGEQGVGALEAGHEALNVPGSEPLLPVATSSLSTKERGPRPCVRGAPPRLAQGDFGAEGTPQEVRDLTGQFVLERQDIVRGPLHGLPEQLSAAVSVDEREVHADLVPAAFHRAVHQDPRRQKRPDAVQGEVGVPDLSRAVAGDHRDPVDLAEAVDEGLGEPVRQVPQVAGAGLVPEVQDRHSSQIEAALRQRRLDPGGCLRGAVRLDAEVPRAHGDGREEPDLEDGRLLVPLFSVEPTHDHAGRQSPQEEDEGDPIGQFGEHPSFHERAHDLGGDPAGNGIRSDDPDDPSLLEFLEERSQ